jgi:hypothetical protein
MNQQAFDGLKAFDFDKADVHLWVFKRSTTEAKYVAYYVRTDDNLIAALREFATHEKNRITEWIPYSHLAEINQNGCLVVRRADANFEPLKEVVDKPEHEHAIDNVDQFKRALGYLVKFVHQGVTVYAVRRSPSTWKTAYRKKGVINAFFRNGELLAIEGDEFTLEPNFDLFCLDDFIVVANKAGFESILQYREGYEKAYETLKNTKSFIDIFADITPLVDYVGTNAMQVKRMAAVEDMKLYEKDDFIVNLKKVNEDHQWGIQFDEKNHIVLTPKNMSLIVRVLLDQRLLSEITHITYDVPSGVPV